MLSTFLHQLSGRENYVNTPSLFLEPTLRLWQELLCYGLESLAYDPCKHLTTTSNKLTHAPPIVTVLKVTFLLDGNHLCMFQITHHCPFPV